MSQDNSSLFSLYLEHGITTIPTKVAKGKEKEPLVNWRKYIEAPPSFEEASEWDKWLMQGKCGIAILCGKNSNIVALDFDSDEFINHPLVPKSACAKFGARGITLLFEYSGEAAANIRPKDGRPGVEVRSEGNIIVIPPTRHKNGNLYTWVGCDVIQAISSGLLNPLPPDFIQEFSAALGYRTEQECAVEYGDVAIPIAELPRMLTFINHNYWNDVVMGTSYAYGEEAYPIVDAWSKADPRPDKYDPIENRSRWASYKHDKEKKVTMLSVIRAAINGGYTVEFEEPIMVETKEEPCITAEPPPFYNKKDFPVMPLSQDFFDSIPGVCGRIMRDMFRKAPTENWPMCLAGALACTAAIKSHRVMMKSGLRPTLIVMGISGPSAGKEAPGKYIKKLLGRLSDGPIMSSVNKRDPLAPKIPRKIGLDNWWFDKPGSAEGLQEALAERARIVTWDEIGKDLIAAHKNPGGHQAGIITAITRISTKGDSKIKSNALANRDGTTPMKLTECPHLNIYGSTVHEHIFEAIGLEGFGGGTWARMLFVWGTTRMVSKLNIPSPNPSQEVVDEIQAWIDANPEQLIEGDPIRVLELTPEDNLRIFSRQVELMDESENKSLVVREIFGRYRERVEQVALVLEDGFLGDNGWEIKTIDSKTVSWAMAFVEWTLRSFCELAIPNRVFRSVADKEFGLILLAIAEEPLTTRQLQKKLRGRVEAKRIETILMQLVQQGDIIISDAGKEPGPGRPAKYWKLSKKTTV